MCDVGVGAAGLGPQLRLMADAGLEHGHGSDLFFFFKITVLHIFKFTGQKMIYWTDF